MDSSSVYISCILKDIFGDLIYLMHEKPRVTKNYSKPTILKPGPLAVQRWCYMTTNLALVRLLAKRGSSRFFNSILVEGSWKSRNEEKTWTMKELVVVTHTRF